MKENSLASILNAPPKVHDWGSGELTSTGMPKEVFEFMDAVLSKDSRTIETGLGISTAVFALKGTHHICITPDGGEIQRIKEYLRDKEIPDDNILFVCKKSCDVWFELKDKNNWNLLLIDGLHGFPTPFMDWYFLSQRLLIDGYLIIDDTHLATGKYLKEFLENEGSWKLVASYYEKTAIFKKIKEFEYNKEFHLQPFILEETRRINRYKKFKDKANTIKRKLKEFTKIKSF